MLPLAGRLRIVEASTIFSDRAGAADAGGVRSVYAHLLLDRDAELGALERGLSAIRSGEGRVVVIEGPAGIGKSSLLAAVARSAGEDGICRRHARRTARARRASGAPLVTCLNLCARARTGAS